LWFVFLLQNKDILRDCRKSPKMAIFAISHVIKSTAYKHQIYRFRVFRQSLRVPEKCRKCRYATISQNFYGLKNLWLVGVTCSFLVKRYFSFPEDICNCLRLFLHSRNLTKTDRGGYHNILGWVENLKIWNDYRFCYIIFNLGESARPLKS